MPATVFPAPGCQSGQQFVLPFQGFDISHDTGGTFSNLLVNSVDLTKPSWIKGINGLSVAAQTPFDIVKEYINDSATVPYQPIYVYKNDLGEHTIVSSSSIQYFGQQVSVLPGTNYTFSFYAKRGTATNATYGVYDLTNSVDIVSATSYYNNINQTRWSRISTTFNTGTSTTINTFVLYNITSGLPGSINVFGPQLDLGSTAKVYDPTGTISWAAQGLTAIIQQSYGRSQLASFSDPAKDFDPIPINGQSSAQWQTVNDYIFDNAVLTYKSAGTNNVLTVPKQTTRPYQVGDTVTVANSNTGYRQNFQVTAFTDSSLTINSTSTVPVNGSIIVNPNPQLYPQSFTTVSLYRSTNVARENLFASTFAPNLRSIKYFLDREFSTTAALSNAFTLFNPKVKGIADRRSVAKVLPRTNVHTPVDRRTTGKILPRTKVHTPVDRRSVSRLESFDNQGIYTGDIFNVAGQNNVKYNSVNQHIFDLDVLSVTVSANGAQQTLFFNTTPNNYYLVRYFPAGFYVRINDTIGNTSYIVQIISSTTSSITFNTIPGFPNRVSGQGLTIQSATSFVYPKTKVDSDMYAYMSANGINLSNYPTNARENLSVSEVKPNFRSATKLSIERNFADIAQRVDASSGVMSTFNSSVIPGDFRLVITGQSADSVNNAVLWYRDELDVLSVIPVLTGLKTVYFPTQDAVPYPNGSEVRISNTWSGLNKIVTVIEGTNYSVSFYGTAPTSSNIERVTASVYPQQYVTTTVAPTTARENLYYSTLAVGLRSNSSITQRKLFATDTNIFNTQKLKSASVVKTVFSPPAVSKLNSAIRVIPDRTTIRVGKLKSNQVLATDRTNILTSIIRKFIVKSNRTQIFDSPQISSLNKQISVLKPDQTILSISSLNKQLSVLKTDQTILSISSLNKQLSVLKTDQTILTVNKLLSATVIKQSVHDFQTGNLKLEAKVISDRNSFAGGLITMFKTGDFKQGSRGIVDVAAPKKEPIQFWN